jgi:hypothetical protein
VLTRQADRWTAGRFPRLPHELGRIRFLAAALVLLALTGCTQVTTGQGQQPVPYYPREGNPDMRSGMDM